MMNEDLAEQIYEEQEKILRSAAEALFKHAEALRKFGCDRKIVTLS